MKTSTLIPVVAYLGLAGLSSAAPIANEVEHSVEKRTLCFWPLYIGCAPAPAPVAPKPSAVVPSSSAKASTVTSSSVVKASASSSSAVKSSAAASSAVKSSAAASVPTKAPTSWSQCNDFDWSAWGSDWTWGGGFDKDYVQKWYVDQYGFAPPPGMNWRQVSSLVSKFGAKTKPATPKTTSKYTGKGCGNPWTSAAPATKTAGAITSAKPVATSAAASSVKVSVSSAAQSSVVVAKPSASAAASSSASASKSSAVASASSSAAVVAKPSSSAQSSSSAAAASSASSAVVAPAASSASSAVVAPAASSASSAVVAPAASSASSAVVAPAASSASSAVVAPVVSAPASDAPQASSSAAADPSPAAPAASASATSDGSSGVPGAGAGVPGTGAGSNNGTATTTVDAPVATASAPVVVNGFTYGGCAQEVTGRLLPDVQTSSASQSIESCTALCASYGFGVAGLEYGNECYCGTLDDVSDALVSGECYMPCSGNANEICGGPNAINWYFDADLAPPSVELPAGWSTYGVVNEGTNGRLLSTQLYSSQDNTVESCAQGCAAAGYSVSGTEYSSECFCGNGFLASAGGGELVDDSAAFMTCSGNLAQKCGGPSILSITSAFGKSIPLV